jgi:hypothetical protein
MGQSRSPDREDFPGKQAVGLLFSTLLTGSEPTLHRLISEITPVLSHSDVVGVVQPEDRQISLSVWQT